MSSKLGRLPHCVEITNKYLSLPLLIPTPSNSFLLTLYNEPVAGQWAQNIRPPFTLSLSVHETHKQLNCLSNEWSLPAATHFKAGQSPPPLVPRTTCTTTTTTTITSNSKALANPIFTRNCSISLSKAIELVNHVN